MTRLFKSSFVRLFAGGFLIGTMGMAAIAVAQPEAPVNAYAVTRAQR